MCKNDDPISVAIILDGGNVQNVLSSVPMTVMLVDYDVEGTDDGDSARVELVQADGRTEEAMVGYLEPELDVEGLGSIKAKILEAEPQAKTDQGDAAWPPVVGFEWAFGNILFHVVTESDRDLLDPSLYASEEIFQEGLHCACTRVLRLLGLDATKVQDRFRDRLFEIAKRAGIAWKPAVGAAA